MTDPERVEVVTTSRPPSCPRCGEEGLLSASIPHGWANASGVQVRGRATIVLCAACDADTPHAAPLITWFHVHGAVQPETAGTFADLVARWAEHLRAPALDEAALDTEVELWRRGEL